MAGNVTVNQISVYAPRSLLYVYVGGSAKSFDARTSPTVRELNKKNLDSAWFMQLSFMLCATHSRKMLGFLVNDLLCERAGHFRPINYP